MENFKGCLDCKHSNKGSVYLLCTHPEIAKRYNTFDSDTGKSNPYITLIIASDARVTLTGKCKREAIYFEPTKYYRFKQWIKQQFNKLFNRA